MNIAKHYESYGESVKRDVLAGYQEFAKTTPTQAKEFPTIFDFLRHTANSIHAAISQNSPRDYAKHLVTHQKAMKNMLSKMVDRELEPWPPDPPLLLDLIQEKGWGYFKFSSGPLLFAGYQMHEDAPKEDLVILPRYEKEWERFFTGESGPYFDADEMSVLLKTRPSRAVMADLFEAKRRGPGLKIVALSQESVGVDRYWSLNLGSHQVVDWTLPLFPGVAGL